MIPGQAQQFFEAAAAQSGAEAGFTIERSLRFNSGDSAYLNRTPSTASNQQTFTWSGWVKRTNFGSNKTFFSSATSNTSNPRTDWQFWDDTLYVTFNPSGSSWLEVRTSRVFRDPSAWYHIVIAVDTLETTNTDRVKVYVNGVRETSFSTYSTISQYSELHINSATQHAIGRYEAGDSNYFPGYLTNIHFIDGQALAATDFGETDSNNNWNPKEYTFNTPKWVGNWASDTTGTPYSAGTSADHAFDANSSTQAAANANGSMVFTPSSPITGITKVRIRAQYDSGTSADILLNGSSIKSSWSDGENAKKEFTVTNLTSLEWQTDGSNLWMSVRSIEIEVDGVYHYLVLGGVNDFYLKFADNSSDAALGTDSSGLNNTWTPNNFNATGTSTPTATVVGDPTSSTDNPFGVGQGYSVDFDGNDEIRFTGPGTVTGDLTVECFYKMDSGSGYDRILSTKEDSYATEQTIIRRHDNGNLQFYFGNGTPEQQSGSISTGTWRHAAMVYDRSATTVTYYDNGSRVGTDSYNNDVPITLMVAAGGYGSENFDGKVSNVRITKQALYSGASYTVPTSTLTTTSQGATASNVTLIACHQSSTTATEGTVGSGADADSLIDSPTNYTADSGNDGGNYATLNPIAPADGALSQGNLQIVTNSSGYGVYTSNFGMSTGKWYAEAVATAMPEYTHFGLIKSTVNYSSSTIVGNAAGTAAYRSNDGIFRLSGSNEFTGATFAAGDVIGLGFDADAGSCAVYKNGALQGTATGFGSGTWFFAGSDNGSGTATHVWNFGQRAFEYTNAGSDRPAATYLSLCTTSLSDPTIADGSTVHDVLTWSGNDSQRDITGLGFSPDLVWIKQRSGSANHSLMDTVRGATKNLVPNDTQSEGTEPQFLNAFLSNGFSIGTSSTVNDGSSTYVAWTWDGGSSTVSNGDGSITSSVRANASAGQSIVSYNGDNNAGDTVGHGLDATPEFIFIKNRDNSFTWYVYHSAIGATKYLRLDSSNAEATGSGAFNNTAPTSSVFSLGQDNAVNDGNKEYIAYCFAPVAGYSAFGSYEGNGSSDGPFVFTGMRPRWVMIKSSSNSGEHWLILDTERDSYNLSDATIYANLTNSEYEAAVLGIDILSNGFKPRGTNAGINASGYTYVYAAFAEHPFKTARGR